MQGSGAAEASSSRPTRCRCDVFLSFGGEDIRKSFIGHLYSALVRAGFRTFRKDDEIKRGEHIAMEVQKAMRESRISIVVFSRDYASSRWCLDELVQIMERRRTDRHHVVPVFYGVDPSHVGQQRGNYAEAFARHENSSESDVDMVQRWRKVLRDVADLRGMVLGRRHESLFVENIVKEVRRKLDKMILQAPQYLVGRRQLIDDINGWLHSGENNVGVATIWGMAGAGKTTVAKTVYNLNSHRFEGSSFLENISEASEEVNGLVRLQTQLLRNLSNKTNVNVWNTDEGLMKIKEAICWRKVLVVLDDVDDLDQFDVIIGMQEWFFPGSKIIITTRCERLLRAHHACEKFRVVGLCGDEALQLLSWHAFGQTHPAEGYMECSKRVLLHCGSLPLALKVIGSSLSGKSLEFWQIMLKKLEEGMDSKLRRILIMSYKLLADDHDKCLFLDIVCFFLGMDKDYLVTVLEGLGYHAAIGIQNLLDRDLVFFYANNTIGMHPLLRNMGREIVFQESPEVPGGRSRLWHYEDALNVLRWENGTETIKGLSLDMFVNEDIYNANQHHSENYSGLKRRRLSLLSWIPVQKDSRFLFSEASEDGLRTDAFKNMRRLQLLRLNYVKLSGSYRQFPRSIVWLCWHGFPLESIPEDFHLENLVALDMCYSKLKQVWRSGKVLRQLKSLDLSHCHYLMRAPDFAGLPALERLVLEDCINLVRIDDSIVHLKKLVTLKLGGCRNLRKLSRKIGMLEYLEELDLSNCSKLEELPVELGQMEALRLLHLNGFSMDQPEIHDPENFSVLWPQSLYSFMPSWLHPRKISKGISFSMAFTSGTLVEMHLANCNLSNKAAFDFTRLISLEKLDLSGNRFHKLPGGIGSLRNLETLSLNDCTELKSIAELPVTLRILQAYNCKSLESIANLPAFGADSVYNFLGCENLLEVEGLLKLKLMTNTDRQIISDLGLFRLECDESLQMEMRNELTLSVKKCPLQVLHECGISSIFLPGREAPSWYSYRSEGSSISFDVTQAVTGEKVSGLNICVVFEGNRRYLEPDVFCPAIFLQNVTKGSEWVYIPSYWCVPREGEGMMWLSHWRLDDAILQIGDHIDVCVKGNPRYFRFKECGVHVVCKAEETRTEAVNDTELLPLENASPWSQTLALRHETWIRGKFRFWCI